MVFSIIIKINQTIFLTLNINSLLYISTLYHKNFSPSSPNLEFSQKKGNYFPPRVGGHGPGPLAGWLADWLATQHTQSSEAISCDSRPVLGSAEIPSVLG